ncbi:MAG TPA: alpha/beta hydrolase-fold protein [Candidatus Babeliales bacterium]|nr:alpha/beta hydrolase-fold protein [Candidatus Babeliales bacterium]
MHDRSELARLLGLEGTVHIDYVESQALAGNPLGDPASRPVAVYLPPGYDAQGSRRFPTLYVLHGYTGDVAALVSTRPWETNVLQWADRLVRDGRMPPALVVLVDGFTRLGGSQYLDSIHNGGYATYVVRDIVGHVDAGYRTVASEGGRAVLGKSSGGFGAMHLVLEHPGVFAAFASHSGDSYFRYAHPPAFATVQRILEAHDFNLGAYVEAFERKPKRSMPEYTTMEMLAYAAAYSPRSATPFDIDLPFERDSGALREDVFARWLAFDPAERIATHRAELARLRLRYLDCGRRDEYNLDVGSRVVAQRIREFGLPVRHEEFDDDHRNVGYRYEISLPALVAVLDNE